ncbi:hypothetical protein [Glaciihabitans sp. dw_435]|uniref:hypothetical protein n=1 Tax=Glaciihabitans sp. dw_435 TaxID=2720081 RepID=UPI001BD5DA58|nr:hypothetical protein [Glaciihabitans sp. dw_435]
MNPWILIGNALGWIGFGILVLLALLLAYGVIYAFIIKPIAAAALRGRERRAQQIADRLTGRSSLSIFKSDCRTSPTLARCHPTTRSPSPIWRSALPGETS